MGTTTTPPPSASPRLAPFAPATKPFHDVVLPPYKPEKAPPSQPLRTLYGYEYSFLLAASVPTEKAFAAAPVTAESLRDGLEVIVDCDGVTSVELLQRLPAYSNHRQGKHRLRIEPDGHIILLDHPEYTSPPGGHSSTLDLANEMFLYSMGADTPPCVRVALCLIAEQLDPSQDWAPLLGFTPSHRAVATYYGNYRTKSLYASVAWAQQPTWPADAAHRYLNSGTTPQVLAYWVEHGWTVEEAVMFLGQKATFTVAERWRAVGDTTRRAAVLAGLGQVPADEQPWLDLGFGPGEADQWRMPPTYGAKFTPDEAFYWHRHGISRTVAKDYRSFPKTNEEAERHNATRPAKGPGVQAAEWMPRIGLPRALAWVQAGVPAHLVLSWYRTVGDDLPTVLTWSGVIPARAYPAFRDHNATAPNPITPTHIADLRRIHIPRDPSIIGIAVEAGLTAADIDRPINMAVHGKRWLGIELRKVINTTIVERHQTDPARDGDPWGARMLQAIADDNWASVIFQLRNPYIGSPLWKPVLTWLSTHPTPPSLT